MKKLLVALLCTTIVVQSAIASDPEITLRVLNGGEPVPGSGTYPSVGGPAAPRPDYVVTDRVTITDFDDLVISVDGEPAAVTTMSLTDSSGQSVADQTAVGLHMDQPISAAITAGAENFRIIDDQCTGSYLADPGEAGSTCTITIEPAASWYGPISGNLQVSTGSYAIDIPLSGYGSHFDPARVAISLVSGNPSAMDITGWAKGVTAYSGEITFRVTNESTEETTDPLPIAFNNPGNFEFVTNACAGAELAPGEACDIVVRAKADQNGFFTGTLTVQHYPQPAVNMAGTGRQFYTYSWKANSWTACSQSCGTGSQSRSIYCQRSDGTNLGDVSGTYPGCDADNRPITVQSCNTHACAWVAGSWGACSASCGGGTRTRSISCRDPNSGATVATNLCNTATRPGATSSCNTQPCCSAESYHYKIENLGGCHAGMDVTVERACNGNTPRYRITYKFKSDYRWQPEYTTTGWYSGTTPRFNWDYGRDNPWFRIRSSGAGTEQFERGDCKGGSSTSIGYSIWGIFR